METKTFTPEALKQYGFQFLADIGEPDCDGISLQLWTNGDENILYDPVTKAILQAPRFI